MDLCPSVTPRGLLLNKLPKKYLFKNLPKRFFMISLSGINRFGPNRKDQPLTFFVLFCYHLNLSPAIVTVVNPVAGLSFSGLLRVSPGGPGIALFNTALTQAIKCMVCPDYSTEVTVHYFFETESSATTSSFGLNS